MDLSSRGSTPRPSIRVSIGVCTGMPLKTPRTRGVMYTPGDSVRLLPCCPLLLRCCVLTRAGTDGPSSVIRLLERTTMQTNTSPRRSSSSSSAKAIALIRAARWLCPGGIAFAALAIGTGALADQYTSADEASLTTSWLDFGEQRTAQATALSRSTKRTPMPKSERSAIPRVHAPAASRLGDLHPEPPVGRQGYRERRRPRRRAL